MIVPLAATPNVLLWSAWYETAKHTKPNTEFRSCVKVEVAVLRSRP